VCDYLLCVQVAEDDVDPEDKKDEIDEKESPKKKKKVSIHTVCCCSCNNPCGGYFGSDC